MERYEQMWEAVEQEHGELSRREAFVTLTAMEWADKTMIEKACEWVENHIFDFPWYDNEHGDFQWRYGYNNTNIEAVRKNKRNIQVAQCDELGNIIKTYPSCNSAAKSNGLTQQVINECVNGKRKSAYGGFIWRKV